MLYNKGGTYDYGRNWYYFCPWHQQEYTKHKGKHRAVLQVGYFSVVSFFFCLWPSELQTLVNHSKWSFQNVVSYHQAYLTNSKTKPSASILFSKALDLNTHPLKPKTLKTLHSWWTLSKFRESKGYLRRQYEHSTHTAITRKTANFSVFPVCRYSEMSKNTTAGRKWHTLPNLNAGHNSFQSNIGVKVSSSGDHQPQYFSELPRGSSSPLSVSLRKMQCPPVFQSLSCERCCSEKGEREEGVALNPRVSCLADSERNIRQH